MNEEDVIIQKEIYSPRITSEGIEALFCLLIRRTIYRDIIKYGEEKDGR